MVIGWTKLNKTWLSSNTMEQDDRVTSEEDKETEYSGRRMEASSGITKVVNIANVLH